MTIAIFAVVFLSISNLALLAANYVKRKCVKANKGELMPWRIHLYDYDDRLLSDVELRIFNGNITGIDQCANNTGIFYKAYLTEQNGERLCPVELTMNTNNIITGSIVQFHDVKLTVIKRP